MGQDCWVRFIYFYFYILIKDRVSFQINSEINLSNYSYVFLLDVNFKNLMIGLYVLYVLNMHVKFCSNRMLFIIQLKNIIFMHNFLPQKLENFKHTIDDIAIDL